MKPLNEIDAAGFAKEVRAMRAEIDSKIGKEDFKHLKKIERWGHLFTIIGYGTAWIFPNPLSVILLSQAWMMRWCIVLHHVKHKGYDKIDCPKRYQSEKFAKGYRRYLDYLDWMHPMAWKYEHNIHHYHTGETEDPDLAQQNVDWVRYSKMPVFFKYVIIFFFICTWKLTYYAPNTFLVLKEAEAKRDPKKKPVDANKTTFASLFFSFNELSRSFWVSCVLPNLMVRFVIIPLLFLPISYHAFLFVLINSFFAEILNNIHTFIVIVSNHAGDDIYRFETAEKDANEFYVRQVIGTVNYSTGNDAVDMLHGWVNYQIEHHLFPEIPILKYQQYQPKVKALCEKYEIPYIQESAYKRLWKLVAVMTGKTSMVQIKSVKEPFKTKELVFAEA